MTSGECERGRLNENSDEAIYSKKPAGWKESGCSRPALFFSSLKIFRLRLPGFLIYVT